MVKFINLQRFAEDGESLPTNDVVTNEDVSFDEEETPTNQKETNNKNAQRRIEAKQKRQSKSSRESYVEGLKKASKNINPFTNEPLEDEDDILEYETMLEIEKNGGDPVEDYRKYLKEQKRKERLEKEEATQRDQQNKDKINNELQEMYSKYGEDKTKQLLQDADFKEFADELIGDGVSLPRAYEKYVKLIEKTEAKYKQQEAEKQLNADARRMSSSGSPSGEDSNDSVLGMSDEKLSSLWRSVASRY